jgi:hypothetical protein
MGPKTLPTISGTYMKLVTKYQISAINSCWEKCDKKWAYTCMFNVYKKSSRQTGSRNLTWLHFENLSTSIGSIQMYCVLSCRRLQFFFLAISDFRLIIPPLPEGGGAPKGILSTHTCGFIMRFSWEIPHKFYYKFANPKVIMNPSLHHFLIFCITVWLIYHKYDQTVLSIKKVTLYV